MYKSMIFENNSQIIELISDADIIVKSVMALLLLMSLVSWSIIFFKLIKFSILKILCGNLFCYLNLKTH